MTPRIEYEKMNRIKASITIYLTLMLLLVMALICTLIESGRVSAINARLRSITYMSADSCFSEFAEPLFSDYGVMFLWCDESEFLEKFNEYVQGNLSLAGTDAKNELELYGMKHVQSSLKDITWATDKDGEVFASQVETYMKYNLAEGVIEEILSGIGLFEQSDKIGAFLDKIQDYKKIFTQVETSVSKIYDSISRARNLASNPKLILGEMEEALNSYSEDPEGASSKFSNGITDLRNSVNEISTSLKDINENTKLYYDSVAEAKGKVDELEEELEKEKKSYTEESYKIIKDEVEDLKTKSADTDADYFHVVENENVTNSYLEKLSNLNSLTDLPNGSLSDENLASYQEMVSSNKNNFEDFNLDLLSVNFEVMEVETEDDDFLDRIDNFANGGLLEFLVGDVSDKETDTSAFPSVTYKKNSEEDDDKESLINATVNKALFSEYVIRQLGNYREVKENSALDYEAEYVLCGKKSDRDNLSHTINKILLIRNGLNLLSILADGQKKAETNALATAIIGFTGQPILVKIVQLLIIAAWALAESIADIKVLYNGGKIATIKREGDWNLSLEGLKNFSEDSLTGKEDQKGLGYKEYLRILLLMQNRTKQYYRTMDILQANMCANENSEFRFKDSIAAVSIDVEFNANMLFTALPVSSKFLKISNGTYQFNFTQDYKY